MNDDDLRQRIELMLDSALTIDEETFLRSDAGLGDESGPDNRWDMARLLGDVGVRDLVSDVLQWRLKRHSVEANRQAHRPSIGSEQKGGPRAQVLKSVLAEEASRRSDVRAFRDAHLPDGVLPSEGAAAQWWDDNSTVGYPAEVTLDDGSTALGWPSDPPAAAAATLATTLAAHFSWSRASALVFLLTGLPPAIYESEVEVVETGHPATRRVVLKIDPAVSPDRVRELYRKVRNEVRPRGLGLRRLALIEFVVEHPNLSWEAKRRQWDRTHPAWRYGQANLANFKRDARTAKRHLLNSQPERQGFD